MKIWLIEISDFLPEIDGANRLYRAGMLYEALAESGHEVVWWSSTFNHQRRLQRSIKSISIEGPGACRIRLLYGPGYRRSVSLKRLHHNRYVASAFVLESSIVPNTKRPEIIYSCLPTLEVSEKAVLFGRQFCIPVVIDIRELYPDNYLTVFPEALRPLLKLVLRTEYGRAHRIFRFATALTASSPAYLEWGLANAKRPQREMDRWFPLGFARDETIKLDSTKLDVINLPKGIRIPAGSFLITYVGSFTAHLDYKTVLAVAEACSVGSEGQEVHFVFVGDGDRYEFLRKRSLHLPNFHLTGWCDKKKVSDILAVSSIGFAPYDFEFTPTLPNKPFEYMAAGKPVLSSLGGALQEIILKERIGLTYRCGDPIDLKGKLQYLLSHPQEVEAMGRRANDLFERSFRSEVVYKKMVQHLEEIAEYGYRDRNAT